MSRPQHGKTATFMPKPIFGDNGSGMHVHQSIWKAGSRYSPAMASGICRRRRCNYIGGITSSTPSAERADQPADRQLKRLIPGFEAPVLLAYSARNRSASCRSRMRRTRRPSGVEGSFPDPGANPYLSFAAMLMRARRHPQQDPSRRSDGQGPVDLPPEELKGIPTVCGSLREAIGALEGRPRFLLAGDVFSMDQIESYLELKWTEVYRFEHTPHRSSSRCYYSI